MKLIKKEITLEAYASPQLLTSEEQALLASAKNILETAYAPYSGFKVGCALLLENGEVVTGNNQENAAYPSGLCAERVAVFQAGARFPGVKIVMMAITAKSASHPLDHPIMSCGACLQSLSEYEQRQNQPIRTLLTGTTGEVWVATKGTRAFLPFQFSANEL